MNPSHFIIQYVSSPRASAEFYARALNCSPIESSDTFAMLPLGEGLMLGLWARPGVMPTPEGGPGSGELAWVQPDAAAVDALYARWAEWGVRMAQSPQTMDFGYTFVGLDPDGHRLRVFAPGAPA